MTSNNLNRHAFLSVLLILCRLCAWINNLWIDHCCNELPCRWIKPSNQNIFSREWLNKATFFPWNRQKLRKSRTNIATCGCSTDSILWLKFSCNEMFVIFICSKQTGKKMRKIANQLIPYSIHSDNKCCGLHHGILLN